MGGNASVPAISSFIWSHLSVQLDERFNHLFFHSDHVGMLSERFLLGVLTKDTDLF